MINIIYHADCWDGFCAAWILSHIYPDATFIPAQYGESIPESFEGKDRDYIIVDFSYKRHQLEYLKSKVNSLLVIDHHKTAEEELKGLDFCHFDLNKSGGRLTWEYFHPNEVAPWLVDYTEDRDLWTWKLTDSREINAALRSYPLDFKLWDDFSKQDPNDFTKEGKAILRREQQIVDQHVKNARFQMIDGYNIPVVNATVLFSEIAGELSKENLFGACYFDRADGKRQWSLRSTGNFDVSEIAKKFGGGGHKNAAGFEIENIQQSEGLPHQVIIPNQ